LEKAKRKAEELHSLLDPGGRILMMGLSGTRPTSNCDIITNRKKYLGIIYLRTSWYGQGLEHIPTSGIENGVYAFP